MRGFYLIATLFFCLACSTAKEEASTSDIANTSESDKPVDTQKEPEVEQLKLGIIETKLKGDTIDFEKPYVARICFNYDSDGWSIDESDSLNGTEMTVCFDGRTAGKITIDDKWEYDYSYTNDKKFDITDLNKVPKIGELTYLFSGWPWRMVYRPLVINTKPYFKDKLKWKPFKPTITDSLLVAGWLNRKYFNSDSAFLKEIKKSYQTASSNRKLINLNLSDGFSIPVPYKDQFKYYEQDSVSARSNLWFLIRDNNKIQQLAPYLTLIDAGDYNQDGGVEVIFMIQTYNYDGYVMYYNDFDNKVDYGWRYH